MSDISVEKEVVMKAIGDIKPYAHNPRRNDKTVELLCKIIPRVGFNVPLVIDKDNVIVKGHARYNAAKKLGMTELPCIITHASADAIKADRIADNKISEFSEWVNEALLHEVDMIDLDFDFDDFGLPKIAYDDIPTIEDFMSEPYDNEDEDNKPEMTDEERRKIYAEFLEKQAQETAQNVQMTTPQAIKAAKENQANVYSSFKDYRKCTCEKCGNVMYVDKNVLYDLKNGTVRRR